MLREQGGSASMNYSKPVKCVIFDCDGTLVDSERWCIQAQVDTLASVGIRVEYEWIKKIIRV